MRPEARIVTGDGARMTLLADHEAELVVTSPPYFSDETEVLLRAPRREQTRLEQVRTQVDAFARTLAPVFAEAFRATRPGGVLVVQTKDLRYGAALVPLAARHAVLAEEAGFRLESRVYWLRTHDSARHVNVARQIERARHGEFRAHDVEEFQILRRPGPRIPLRPTDEWTPEEYAASLTPLWRTPGPGGGVHPHASPTTMVRRFIQLYSRPGDLVVDPFAGSGTTVLLAARLGRRGVGYEIDGRHAAQARIRLEKDLKKGDPHVRG